MLVAHTSPSLGRPVFTCYFILCCFLSWSATALKRAIDEECIEESYLQYQYKANIHYIIEGLLATTALIGGPNLFGHPSPQRS